ncbi:hypothetical protein [Cellulosimicrobium cellulans]|uniref:hypothetical protein n=1 Tax=Cellulosimicrobium cellulans TaxID=1710 RepID=UPI00130D6E09|nr:hypothetical protein [Cellulosimicrobium cellulans]
MTTDLSRALDDLARSAASLADLGPVDHLVARRRRRRAARRASAGAGALAVTGALVLAVSTGPGWRPDGLGPAATASSPATAASPTPTAPGGGAELPGCGEPVPRESQTLSPAVSIVRAAMGSELDVVVSLRVQGASAADLEDADVRIYVLWDIDHSDGDDDGDYMLALLDVPPGGWTDAPGGATRDVTGTPEGCPGIQPGGNRLVAAMSTPDGTVVSGVAQAERRG